MKKLPDFVRLDMLYHIRSIARVAIATMALGLASCGKKEAPTSAAPAAPPDVSASDKPISRKPPPTGRDPGFMTPPKARRTKRELRLFASGFEVNRYGKYYSVSVPVTLPADPVKAVDGFAALRSLGFLEPKYGQEASPVSDAALRALSNLPGLEELTLENCPNITDAAFANLNRFPKLNRIFVSNSKTVGDGLASEAAKVPKLQALLLPGTALTDDGLATISKIPTLTLLRVDGTKTTEKGLKSLKELREIENLWLYDLPVTEAVIAEWDFPKLRTLYISGEGVTDAALARLQRLPALEQLNVLKGSITNTGILALKQFPKLRSFWAIMDGKVTKAGGEALMKAKPGLNVVVIEK